ncbi:tyrosine-protein phosphatase non-receptor type substrate 1-like isoform X2 [Heptranchias perlo]|uniref:tyrosine-protein phosphatase non-receptor type substrate 1-like isoform X2 n=1 Tax=Heptranchias perlo TaxID=212740 RepID=UPI00355AAF69
MSLSQIPHITSTVRTILLLLTIADYCHGELVVVQEPSFVSRPMGQSVILNCSYTFDQENIYRSAVYWTLKGHVNGLSVIYPGSPAPYGGRLVFTKHGEGRDFSLLIRNLQIKDTERYFCYISFLVGEDNLAKEGKGTKLFVYDPLVLSPPANCSCGGQQRRVVSCATRVADGNEVQIVWLRNGALVSADNASVTPSASSKGTYNVVSQISLTRQGQDAEVRYRCVLNHTSFGTIDSRQYIDVSAAHKHPILLYVLIIMNSVAVLVLIILFSLKRPFPCASKPHWLVSLSPSPSI